MKTVDLDDVEFPLRPKEIIDGVRFDYSTMAELFVGGGRGATPRAITYRRFAKASNAIRFAIEELPAAKLADTILEVDESRFRCREIRELYDSVEYPLPRPAPARRVAVRVLPATARTGQHARHQAACASRYRVRLTRPGV
jgi:hypothetical protein